MKLLKLRNSVKYINEYEGFGKGLVTKDVISIKLEFLGMPIRTIKRYKIQYNGDYVIIDSKYRKIDKDSSNYSDSDVDIDDDVELTKSKIKLIKSKIKHTQTREFVITLLMKINKESDSPIISNIIEEAISELESNEDYNIDLD